MKANEMILIETLKDIEPALKEYFAYDRAMLYPEIERMYLATHPAGLHNIQPEDKYRVEVPSMLDELATSDNPFDWQRYAPREPKMTKVVDTLAYMTDNIKGILFKDDGLKKKIEELVEGNNIPEEHQVAMVHVLWILAIIYKKHEAFKPILDPELLEETYNMDTYFQQVRPEMLQLYLFLERDKRKKDKSITLSNNQEKITINNAMESWFSNLLDSYLHIYLGVNSIEEAEEELKEVYSSKKGRKADNPARNLVIMGIYRLLKKHSQLKDSKIHDFIYEYMCIIEEGDVVNATIKSVIEYFKKGDYKPQWVPASQGNYRISPNNPSKLYFW
ncbi:MULTISPECIES: hypothetical protein [Butyricimonas]|uniref:hypothetical protein n=1 Tax=Butyricimonas TaxID=574697 RepID=UPI0011DD9952|nr:MULTISPECIES: hypothetical protein [Butyricimonas]